MYEIRSWHTYSCAFGFIVKTGCDKLFVQCPRILPRIFANICHLHDVEVRRTDFSIRANTFAPRDAIPSVVYIAVRRVNAGVTT